MKKGFFCALLLSLGLTACAVLDRSPQSGYSNAGTDGSSYATVDAFYRSRAHDKWSKAQEELGYGSSRELSEFEAQTVRDRLELKRLEDQLHYSLEKKQYYGFKPYMKSDRERIQFLQLPTREARERWARQRGIASEEVEFDPGTLRLIEAGDVAKNMTKKAVQQSWGEPNFKDIAGDPVYGNECWHYNKMVSTEDGYKTETRLIYFEGGLVSGWETR